MNNAVSVLRGFIYMLVAQQNTLVKHLKDAYKYAGSKLVEGDRAFST